MKTAPQSSRWSKGRPSASLRFAGAVDGSSLVRNRACDCGDHTWAPGGTAWHDLAGHDRPRIARWGLRGRGARSEAPSVGVGSGPAARPGAAWHDPAWPRPRMSPARGPAKSCRIHRGRSGHHGGACGADGASERGPASGGRRSHHGRRRERAARVRPCDRRLELPVHPGASAVTRAPGVGGRHGVSVVEARRFTADLGIRRRPSPEHARRPAVDGAVGVSAGEGAEKSKKN